MAKIQLKSKVIHMPGIWGPNLPVKGAKVEVFDVDLPSGTDKIWSGTTNSSGNFQGTSKEWQDSKKMKVWVPMPPPGRFVTKKVPDPTDVLMLKARVKQGNKVHEVFPFVNTEFPPIIVPWGPPDAPTVVANVNGVDITLDNVYDIYEKIKDFAEDNVPTITVRVYGPYATALAPLTKSRDALRKWVFQHLDLPASSSVLTPNPADWVIVSVATIVAVTVIALGLGAPIALGAGVFIACLGIALILAVHLGYVDIEAKQCSRGDVGPGEIPVGWENCVEIKLSGES